MLLRVWLCVLILCGSTIPVFAEDYRIATIGRPDQPAVAAIADMAQRLGQVDADIGLTSLPNSRRPTELLESLRAGDVDFAVVPIDALPGLSNSPLLTPFIAEDAARLRQAINSDAGAQAKATLDAEGYRVLDFWHVSSTILGSSTQVRDVSDLAGLKVRASGRQRGQTLAALGATPVQIAGAEVYSALQSGAFDSSDVPFNERAQSSKYFEVLDNYVDRIYGQQIFAVLVLGERWEEIPFPQQHYLAKTAVEVGEALVSPLTLQAAQFRRDALANGAALSAWQAEDVRKVQAASLRLVSAGSLDDRALVSRAFEAAAADPAPVTFGEARPATEVKIYFATDRKPADPRNPETAFSSIRQLNGHTFGTATVQLQPGRKLGQKLTKTAKIVELDSVTKANFLQSVAVDNSVGIIVFVHGYNNAFVDSIRRGATIQADIAANAKVISYTWPSDGELLSYGYDDSSTDTAIQTFKIFMDSLTDAVDPGRINIVAHSMGGKLVTAYLAGLAERSKLPADIKFNEVVFAASDVSKVFFQQKEETPFIPDVPISAHAERITLYTSQYDRPLLLSKKVNRDLRLGLGNRSNIYVHSNIDTVDSSLIDPAKAYQIFSFATRHSYVFDKPEGVRDLKLLLGGSDTQTRPGIVRRSRDGLSYWVLEK
ncbi:TRAP transporter substrate-binding protein DctP [Sulfitobacter geojensis]|uniref:TRAP transporter substrate-binding protein DctP n=1 Tax=Sulfitobacter geojensis TaxID=1342299 RepID=A0AAE3B8R8_9RHOB|nr:TRAP transporter substrate-binding protein DctP [Sulfitobacter geojensis]MBM1691611.1 TRAP transporter substrate-binding protein DctP [Sulfitobacter geojensis]MBM1695677.1 TRAP transporter substrate-binding protein DctP [Sulfitobacter geojensis]MBM1707842.1 TRAP transporter substrate-binding protein DctP [Sulfitobacter geojensis]MBM1711901.1 TRAP transporter substrate-binding protein DctP [Sulfitobacter geojensis]MBM1715966.1 TRAP transporter substrate-binding protein DctP [Sulfitobacter ge